LARLFPCRAAPRIGVPALCLALVALVLAGCGTKLARLPGLLQGEVATQPPQTIVPGAPSEPATAEPGAPVKVALLLPLSGPSAGLGRSLLDAAQMALFDIADDHLLLMPRDTTGTTAGAARAAEAALKDGAQLILGPLLAAEVEAVKPVAQQANVNVIAFTTNGQLAGDGTFLLSFLPRQNVERVVAYAQSQGAQRYALLAPSTPYGQLVLEALRGSAAKLGTSVTATAFYDPGATDMRAPVRQLAGFDQRKAALERERRQLAAAGDDASRQALARLAGRETVGDLDFDAVLIPDGGAKLKAVASLLPYFDIDPAHVHVLGTGLWDEPGLASEPALIGGWFAAPDPAARAEFESRFRALYKRAPPRLATLGYDAAALAAVLAKRPRATAFRRDSIADPSGFAGVDGIFRFHSDGVVERGLAVLQVERDGTKVVNPAPESFEQPAS
jgi:branched-chain amino acid transport system substrate-binding protein